MPNIYVETDNSDPKHKLFIATRAGKSAAAAEKKLQEVVKRIIDKTSGFTTINKSKGYVIRLEVAKVEVSGGRTKCSLTGSIVRYPPVENKEGKEGEEMVSTGMTGNGLADGTSEGALLDCIEAIAEDLVAKSIPMMRKDYVNR